MMAETGYLIVRELCRGIPCVSLSPLCCNAIRLMCDPVSMDQLAVLDSPSSTPYPRCVPCRTANMLVSLANRRWTPRRSRIFVRATAPPYRQTKSDLARHRKSPSSRSPRLSGTCRCSGKGCLGGRWYEDARRRKSRESRQGSQDTMELSSIGQRDRFSDVYAEVEPIRGTSSSQTPLPLVPSRIAEWMLMSPQQSVKKPTYSLRQKRASR